MSDQTPHKPDPHARTAAQERQYLLKRAEDHRRLAAMAADEDAQGLHLTFQRLYQERADRIG
ncbi:MAG: hypothetical protein PSY12_05720 [bacterium]|nr:hypothetical protein [bacterium]